jgi:sigma-E factor negative regulatory protein RseB
MNRLASRPLRWGVAALVFGLAVADSAAAAEAADLVEASRLLARMTVALGTLDYEGTLVYLADNRLETLHLVHHVGSDGGVEERLESLSGPVRALARAGNRVSADLPDGTPLRVGTRVRRQPAAAPIDPAAIAERYRIEVLGPGRIAGRETEVVRLRPRDALRYGNLFHLDRASGLPLKSDLIDDQGEPVEQLLFTDIAFTEVPGGNPVRSPAGSQADAPGAPDPAPPAAPPGRWRFEGRAPGFELAAYECLDDGESRPVEHYLFSDRLSSYSVYVEQDAATGLDGSTRIGAVHAAGRIVDGHRVTAVGEVPAATVEAAVAGVARGPDDSEP